MKNKTRKNKKEIKKMHKDARVEKIEKLTIKDDVGCITVNNSFEENFKNYLKSKTKSGKDKDIHAKKNSESVAKELIRVFDKPLAPKSINPKNDFYTYVNYDWLKKMKSSHTNKYYTRIDSFRMLQETVYYQLIDIVKSYTSQHSDHKSKMMHNVYESFLHLDESVCENHWINIKKELDKIFE